MSTAVYKNEIDELILSLEKVAPRSCSKPKSEMCSKCIDRVYSDRAVQIQEYLAQLKEIKAHGAPVPAVLETAVIELLHSK